MAPHSYEPTTAAALRPFLRAIVNVLRGRSSGGSHKGEGRERRIDWNARLQASLRPDENYMKRREAGKRGWRTRRGV